MQINVREAKTNLSRLIRLAQAGEEVVIAFRGEPVVKLVAVTATESGSEGRARDFVAWLRNNPLLLHLQRSSAEIEAGIAAERNSWE